MTDLRCWFDFEDGHTCMSPEGHEGPHEPTSDSDIMIRKSGTKTMTPSNVYDPLEWEIWLVAHGFDIENVYQLDFHDDGKVTVHSYRRDEEGRAYVINYEKDGARYGEVATEEPVTIVPKSEIPVWS